MAKYRSFSKFVKFTPLFTKIEVSEAMSYSKSVRLNKYIGQSGICSRREADKYIEEGRVKINGKKASISNKVKPGDIVMVNGQTIEPEEVIAPVIIALNKPVGIVCTTESSERDNIVSFTNYPTRIFPIGRLDKESNGLILMTNDGDIVNKILRAGNNHEKEYVVSVDKDITDDFIEGMAGGVPILGMVTKKCKVEKESQRSFRITLVQGLNRQIRRMCEHFGFEVQKLERVRIMHISLKGLPDGEFRDLDNEELNTLFKLIENSSSEADPNTKSRKKHTTKAKASGSKSKSKTKTHSKKSFSGKKSSKKKSFHSSKKSNNRPGKKQRRR